MSLPPKSYPMVLFYLVMGLGLVTILIFLNYTTGLGWILILLVLTVVAAAVAVSSIMLSQFAGAPWVPTNRKLVKEILTMAEVKPGELLYDLGSGDGRLVIAAAKDFGANSIGIEIDPFRVFYSRLKIWQYRLEDRVKIIEKNFFNVDLRDADMVVTFLLQATNDKLQKKLESELRPSSRVVSLVFQFKGWEEIKVDKELQVYVFRPRPFLHASP